MRAFHSQRSEVALPPGHRFPQQKYARLLQAVAAQLPQVQLEDAPLASADDLLRAHDADWVAATLKTGWTPQQAREIGFPWSLERAERACRSVGATLAAARLACWAGEGVAVNLGGGTHHARAGAGAGFCVFNDVAVATRCLQAEALQAQQGPLRVLVLDLDVHQGDGTASLLGADPEVFTVSLHGARNFPVRKVPSHRDIELPDGCDDALYHAALDRALGWVSAEHDRAPFGLAFYLAGADVHRADRLGRLGLTAAGVRARDRRVLQALLERRVPVAVLMAGGYGEPIEQTVALHLQTVADARVAAQAWAAGGTVGAGAWPWRDLPDGPAP